MPTAVTADTIAEAANSPASAAVDGQSASAHSISEQLKALQNNSAADALAGTNDSGGPVSGWSKLRTARAKNAGAVQ